MFRHVSIPFRSGRGTISIPHRIVPVVVMLVVVAPHESVFVSSWVPGHYNPTVRHDSNTDDQMVDRVSHLSYSDLDRKRNNLLDLMNSVHQYNPPRRHHCCHCHSAGHRHFRPNPSPYGYIDGSDYLLGGDDPVSTLPMDVLYVDVKYVDVVVVVVVVVGLDTTAAAAVMMMMMMMMMMFRVSLWWCRKEDDDDEPVVVVVVAISFVWPRFEIYYYG